MRTLRTCWAVAVLTALPAPCSQVLAQGTRADYERAERFLPRNLATLVFNLDITPHWIEGEDEFWFREQLRDGHRFQRVDAATGTVKAAFDHERMAAAVTATTSTECSATDLPFQQIEFEAAGSGSSLRFQVGEDRFSCDLSTFALTPLAPPPKVESFEVASPDGRWAAFAEGHDLFVRELASARRVQLTHDGVQHHAYGQEPDTRLSAVTEVVMGVRTPPAVLWSPDSTRLVTIRTDQRRVPELALLQSVPPAGSDRPVTHRYRYPFPGDWNVPLIEYLIFDLARNSRVEVQQEPVETVYMSAISLGWLTWTEDSQRLTLLQSTRGFKTTTLETVDANSGEVNLLMEETSETYADLHLVIGGRPNARVVGGGAEVIWFSQRDGWGHLYLHDCATGQTRQVTRGEWVVRDLMHIDEEQRVAYFTASGREPGRDVYLRHLYRVGLDGAGLQLLTPENADHSVQFSPGGGCFVDTFSRVDQPPVSVVRDASGRQLAELVTADIDLLLEAGWRWPERFCVKARDGKTDIYGVLFRPSSFESGRKYPVLDSIYPGPQISRAPYSFSLAYSDPFGAAVSMAELGFVVVAIDGMGTPLRSKAFVDVSYEKIGEAGGLEDHIAALRQLAEEDPSLDLERVGIYGHSGGGYASARAILQFPEFYKVAVSSAGNHDQRRYLPIWGERYHGLRGDVDYEAQANSSLAANLKGKLFLVHGELDDNVSPVLTMQLVDALVRENKDFDLLILPGANHGLGATEPYFTRRKWDYFVRHLLGVEPPADYRIGEAMKKKAEAVQGDR